MSIVTKQISTFTAADIHCEGCANAIRKSLSKIPGVSDVAVNIDAKTVRVEHDTTAADTLALAAALDRVGFPVTKVG